MGARRMLTIDGLTQSVSAWAKHFGATPSTVRARLERGVPLSEAFAKTHARPPHCAHMSRFRQHCQQRVDAPGLFCRYHRERSRELGGEVPR